MHDRPSGQSTPSSHASEHSPPARRLSQSPHCAALLDASGGITAINEAWRKLGEDDFGQTIHWAQVGESLTQTPARSSAAALELRAGLSAVLSGERARFEHTYRCHSATGPRWYKLQAERLESTGQTVLVEQLEVTELQQAYARLRIQNAVATAFNSRLPMLAGCRQLALTLCQELDWDFAGIWTLDPTSWTLRCVDTWFRPDDQLLEFERKSRSVALSPETGLPGRVWSSAQVQWVTNLDIDTARIHAEHAAATIMPPAALRSGFRTALCFPLKCAGDVLAVVEVFSRSERAEDRPLMELLDVAGDQLALWELRERAENYAVVAQQQADQARVQLESVLDCTPAFITAIDRSGHIMFVNKTIPPERKASAIDAPWRHFVGPDSQAQVERALKDVFASGTSTHYEAKLLLPDGKWLWFANYMGPMRSGDDIVGAVIVSQDVTASKRSQEELLAAQRLAAVGTLAAGVAHEINTPVQFVNDSIHFLRDATRDMFDLVAKLQTFHRLVGARLDTPALQAASSAVAEAEENADLEYMHDHIPKAFERCIDGLERVATIVRSMKEFSHPAQKEMAPVDLNRAIMATLTVARNEYKYLADLETVLGELPLVMCHANEINQAVLNIVVNAAHAIGDAPQKGERGLITVRTASDGECVTISISDTGGGIPEAVREHVFDPFFTTKEVGRGTGQGLSIAWASVKEKHGGELSFETVVGQGTTFHIRLPIMGRGQVSS